MAVLVGNVHLEMLEGMRKVSDGAVVFLDFNHKGNQGFR